MSPDSKSTVSRTAEALATRLQELAPLAVAVSGGVDSLTLATLAARRLGRAATMFHAVSPAVPPEATQRVRDLAAREGWSLHVIDAAEFARDEYVANPVDRCFYCKESLYSAIAARTGAQIVSGANTDDLGEYRPGLDAARAAGVRHPFVEAGIDKRTIRALARDCGLGSLAELPAAPCLSSRVETGIDIRPAMLASIHAAESAVRARVGSGAPAVRCRVRASGVVIEIDAATLAGLSDDARRAIAEDVRRIFAVPGSDGSGGLGRAGGSAIEGGHGGDHSAPLPRLEPYRNGSAFLVKVHARTRHPA